MTQARWFKPVVISVLSAIFVGLIATVGTSAVALAGLQARVASIEKIQEIQSQFMMQALERIEKKLDGYISEDRR